MIAPSILETIAVPTKLNMLSTSLRRLQDDIQAVSHLTRDDDTLESLTLTLTFLRGAISELTKAHNLGMLASSLAFVEHERKE